MKVAAAQIASGENPQDNLNLVEQWTADAAAAGASVVVFPEATQRAFGYDLTSVAEDDFLPWARKVRHIAQRHGIVVVVGVFSPGQPNHQGSARVKNTLLAVGPSVYSTYDKLHLYDAFGFKESDTVEPGDRRVQISTGGLNFGLATCYDIRFPQLFTGYAAAGTHASLVPASWQAGEGKVDQWSLLCRARALDSTQYIIACGQALPEAAGIDPPQGAPSGVGHSMIVSPTGEVLAEAGAAAELLVAEISAETVRSAREQLPVLANAREL